MAVETDTDTVIVGASAAGLATAACLQRASVPFVLLEERAQVAGAWRTQYDPCICTPARASPACPTCASPAMSRAIRRASR